MNKRKQLLRRMLRALLPMIILAGIIIGSYQVSRVPIKANTESVYAKATITAILNDHSNGEEYAGTQQVEAKVTSGIYKGQVVSLSNANSYQQGALCVPGTKVIALVQEGNNGVLSGSVYNYDRSGMVFGLVIVFALCLLAVGGKKGAASFFALVFTFVCIICLYIPLLYVGVNGILAGIISAIVILTASIYILNGWSRKSLCAIIGTTGGVCVSGILALLFGSMSHLNGYAMSDVESMVYISNHTSLGVAALLYAGILISSLGAVMDVSVSVVAAMEEIWEKAPGLSPKELFVSGMHVGHDMMGTMSNTLILAYTGSATGTLLTMYAYEMPYLQIMGYNSIIIEILCGLCGTIGVILTVPLQAAVTTLFLKHRPKPAGRPHLHPGKSGNPANNRKKIKHNADK